MLLIPTAYPTSPVHYVINSGNNIFCKRQWKTCVIIQSHYTGHEITPNTVTNATNIIVPVTKIKNLVTNLATILFAFCIHCILPCCVLQLNKTSKYRRRWISANNEVWSVKQNRHQTLQSEYVNIRHLGFSNITLYTVEPR